MLPLAAVILSLFVGIAPASGLDCLPPQEVISRAMKSQSATFFTGKATSIERVSSERSNVTFDVELFWHGPQPPGFKALLKGQQPQKYPTFVVNYFAVGDENDLATGGRYHVVFENKSANPCSVFDAEDYPNLTDGINPEGAFGDFTPRGGIDSSGPVDNDEAKAHWWSLSIGAAVLLGAATLAAVLVARRRRGTGHPGLGAIIGLDVGAALAWWLILLPRLRDGDFYEVGDPLIVMGLPLLIVGAAIGATVGTFIRRGTADSAPSRSGRSVAVVLTSLVACLLATWWWLGGIGAVRLPF